jgi:AbiV family abortive infection protein
MNNRKRKVKAPKLSFVRYEEMKNIAKGHELSLKNARSLVEEAKILLAANKQSRSLALALLGYEEYGKAAFLAKIFFEASSVNEERYKKSKKKLISIFTGHPPKIRAAATIYEKARAEQLLVERGKSYEEARREAAKFYDTNKKLNKSIGDLNKLKQNCIYVQKMNGEIRFNPPVNPRKKIVKSYTDKIEYLIAESEEAVNTLKHFLKFNKCRTKKRITLGLL